jgi:2-polyprenyl-3-methyl-5-hydroxy-6-metoxy-1,4-benzoquinol methylase
MTQQNKSLPITVPSLQALQELRQEGMKIGYRGIFIYLRYQAILETLSGMSFSRALGVGAGYGIFDRLLPESLDYTGVDISAEAIAFADGWAAQHRPTYRYLQKTLWDCAFSSEHFDLVLLSEVIEHIPEQEVEGTLQEIERLLCPGGYLLLTVPNRWQVRNRIRWLLGKELVWMDPTHLREYSLREIRALVRALPLTERAFRPAVLYLPCETMLSRWIRPEGVLRRRLIRLCHGIASHFIFLLQKTQRSER